MPPYDPETVALLREFLHEHREIRELLEKALAPTIEDRGKLAGLEKDVEYLKRDLALVKVPPAAPSKNGHSSNGLLTKLLGHEVSKGIAHGLVALALIAIGWIVRHLSYK